MSERKNVTVLYVTEQEYKVQKTSYNKKYHMMEEKACVKGRKRKC